MESAAILSYFDDRFSRFDMPCFSNMNIDYLSSRMSVYRSDAADWVVVFNSIVWWPAADGLMTLIETVGPSVVGRQGFDNDRHVEPGRLDTDDSGMTVTSVKVRGNPIELSSLSVHPKFELEVDEGFWVAVALLPDYREELLASDLEVRKFVPSHLSKTFQIDSWQHPDIDLPPSATETFPKLASALCTGDFTALASCNDPNTHWSNWLPK